MRSVRRHHAVGKKECQLFWKVHLSSRSPNFLLRCAAELKRSHSLYEWMELSRPNENVN